MNFACIQRDIVEGNADQALQDEAREVSQTGETYARKESVDNEYERSSDITYQCDMRWCIAL